MTEYVLALDVDGVLLDPERGGDGDWTNELERRFGITRPQIREAFFAKFWDDVIVSHIVFVDDASHNVDQARAAGWTALVALPDLAWVADVDALFARAGLGDFGASK